MGSTLCMVRMVYGPPGWIVCGWNAGTCATLAENSSSTPERCKAVGVGPGGSCARRVAILCRQETPWRKRKRQAHGCKLSPLIYAQLVACIGCWCNAGHVPRSYVRCCDGHACSRRHMVACLHIVSLRIVSSCGLLWLRVVSLHIDSRSKQGSWGRTHAGVQWLTATHGTPCIGSTCGAQLFAAMCSGIACSNRSMHNALQACLLGLAYIHTNRTSSNTTNAAQA